MTVKPKSNPEYVFISSIVDVSFESSPQKKSLINFVER